MLKGKYKLHQRIIYNGLNARIIGLPEGLFYDGKNLYYHIRLLDNQRIIYNVKEVELTK